MDLIRYIISFSLTGSKIIWLVVGVVAIIFIGISWVLAYHWLRYGINQRTIRTVMVTYFGVSLLLWYSIISASLAITSV